MPFATTGLHHVTAVATRPQGNVDFYVRTLGLRLVKRTVNFDDPRTYHLYYGDARGNPGTLLSFLTWPGVGAGHPGTGEACAVSLAVPTGALGYWRERLEPRVAEVELRERFGQGVLVFHDPDGLPLELVECDAVPSEHWANGDVAPEHAIRGLAGVTLRVDRSEPTAEFLARALGLEPAGAESDGAQPRVRLALPGGAPGCHVDLLAVGEARAGRLGAGTVHHVAFRAPDAAAQGAARDAALAAGATTAKLQDRVYFTTLPFQDPGGTLVEVATDGPGFTVDEPVEELGLALRLPTWLEEDRQFLRGRLPVIASPEYADRWSTH